MNPGDLVKLSKYGKQLKINQNCLTGYGIVITKLSNPEANYPILVLWLEDSRVFEFYFSRRELKKYKPDTICPLQNE